MWIVVCGFAGRGMESWRGWMVGEVPLFGVLVAMIGGVVWCFARSRVGGGGGGKGSEGLPGAWVGRIKVWPCGAWRTLGLYLLPASYLSPQLISNSPILSNPPSFHPLPDPFYASQLSPLLDISLSFPPAHLPYSHPHAKTRGVVPIHKRVGNWVEAEGKKEVIVW